jgi:hypothetical protein
VSAWGLQLVSAILQAEAPREAYEFVVDVKRILPKHLLNLEARAVLQFIKTWYERPQEFGLIPSKGRVLETFPQILLPQPQEPIPDLAETVKKEFLKQQLQAISLEFAQRLEEEVDPMGAFEDIRQRVMEIDEQYVTDADVDFVTSGTQIVTEYLKKLKESDGLLGIPWPWDELNKETQGIQEGDLVVFYGLPKSMKTWIVLYLAIHLIEKGYKVLVFSREMTATTMALRCAAILAKLSYSRLRAGNLNMEEWERLWQAQDRAENIIGAGKLIFTRASKPDGAPGGVSDIHRKVLRYKPNLVILDSAYMMSNDRASSGHSLKWGDLTAIAQDVKQMATTSGVPSIMIWQENEAKAMKFKGSGGRGTASVAMASQLIYYCDIAVRCILNAPTSELSLVFAATREFQFDGFTIHANPGHDFSFSKWELYDVAEKPAEGTGNKDAINTAGAVKTLASMFKNSMGSGGSDDSTT